MTPETWAIVGLVVAVHVVEVMTIGLVAGALIWHERSRKPGVGAAR